MADWSKITHRGNVDDRRGLGMAAGGLGGLGLVGTLLVIGINLLGGGSIDTGSLNQVLNQLQQSQATRQTVQPEEFQGADDYEEFAAAVLGSTNQTWQSIFEQDGKQYDEPTLVLFRDATRSACGAATSQVGPHYCPLDATIYIDETFFDELQRRFGAKGGDVAEAYVIAHEVGHHVQNELGIMDQVQRTRQQDNQVSINLELQADCYAGIWAHSVADLGVFEPGEINEAIDAAEAVGDDRIQESVQGQVNPESWTHGSSAQRAEWFNRGFESGQPATCDTFQS